MTDEQFVGYLDAHQERATTFVDAVEAVRMGTLFAHDGTQYTHWRANVARQSGQKPDGATTIEQLARDYPDHVGKPN